MSDFEIFVDGIQWLIDSALKVPYTLALGGLGFVIGIAILLCVVGFIAFLVITGKFTLKTIKSLFSWMTSKLNGDMSEE